jgi:hypothetical protein
MTKTLLPVLGALAVLAGCSGGDGVGDTSSEASLQKGVDYSDARPSPKALHVEGYTFVVRYLSNYSPKNLTKSEADTLKADGLDVVVVWEDGAQNSLGGYNQGVKDAKEASAQANADGMPAGRPIYFAIDFDAQASEQSTINAYFDGVASVIGRARTGAYGGYYVIERLFNDSKIAFGWQTYAWSYGHWDGRAQLRQVQNDITAAGDSACCDKDVSAHADFGQWWHVSSGGGGGGGGSPAPDACSEGGGYCTETLQCDNGHWIIRQDDPSACTTIVNKQIPCSQGGGYCTATLQCDNDVWVPRSSDPSACTSGPGS